MKYIQIRSGFLLEMNVSNIGTIKTDFRHMLEKLCLDANFNIPVALLDMITKRAVKAMQNDDAGNMTTKKTIDISNIPDDAPIWLRKSIENGDEVVEIDFKDGFQERLAHVVDWLRDDPQSVRVVKAAPENNYLGHLGQAADAFYAKKNAEVQVDHSSVNGQETVMTFRRDQTGRVNAFMESDMKPNQYGRVISFIAKLTSAAALNREGKLMNHCVGSYANEVASEHVIIYSLRDMSNNPHATIEMRNTNPPSINQVKGSGNRAPVGKYAPYIKDFLNALGVRASHSGSNDIRGMGLLTHDGKFGTILDVGGTILTTFPNGDSIRTTDTKKITSYSRLSIYDYMYVEKDGTIPFTFNMSLSPESDVSNVTNGKIASLDMLRKEVSRFGVYAKNLIPFLIENHLKGDVKVFEKIGLFYDPIKNIWGMAKDITEEILNYKGNIVSRIATELFISDSKGIPFATANITKNSIRNLKVINDIDDSILIPEIVEAIANKMFKTAAHSDDDRRYIASFGLFWNDKKDTYTSVPEDRSILKSKNGEVKLYRNRLFFYNPTKQLVGSTIPNKENFIENSKFVTYSNKGRIAALNVLVDLTANGGYKAANDFSYGQWYDNEDNIRNIGFYLLGEKIVHLSSVEGDKKLGNGYTSSSKITESGRRNFSLVKGGNVLVNVYTDTNNTITIISYEKHDNVPEIVTTNRYSDSETFKPFILPHLKYLAALFNVEKIQMKKWQVLENYMNFRNGKFVALDPVKDKMTIDFINKKVSLGNNLFFKRDGNLSRDYEDTSSNFGYIDEGNYSTVCRIEREPDSDELSYKIRKSLPDGITRAQVIKAVAQFMAFYHDRIEMYIDNDMAMAS